VQNVNVKLSLCLLNTTLSRIVGGLGTVPRTRVLRLCNRWRLGSASGDGRFTSLRKPQSTPPILASALLFTRLCGPTSRSGVSYRSVSYNTDWNIWGTIKVRI